MTFPVGPTASAAGRAEAPVPQQTSSTREPLGSAASSIVRRPKWSQKLSGDASKKSAAALYVNTAQACAFSGRFAFILIWAVFD